jgi:hypothetical protein
MGAAWTELNTARFRWARFARGAFQVLPLAIGLGLCVASFHPKLPIPGWTLWPAGLAALLGGIALWRESRWTNPPSSFFLLAALVWLAVQWAVGLFIYPAVNPLKTPVELARAVQAQVPPDRPLLIYRVNGEILAYYSNRRGEVAWHPEDLQAAMQREKQGIVVFSNSGFDEWSAGVDPLPGVAHPFRMGKKRLVWLAFGSLPGETVPDTSLATSGTSP